jgi:hypothetical protein
MTARLKVNLANPMELQELPGIGQAQADVIIAHRAAHGPIRDAGELRTLLNRWAVPDALWDRVDFDPALTTAPEAPGA